MKLLGGENALSAGKERYGGGDSDDLVGGVLIRGPRGVYIPRKAGHRGARQRRAQRNAVCYVVVVAVEGKKRKVNCAQATGAVQWGETYRAKLNVPVTSAPRIGCWISASKLHTQE
jgi:hypothetical protein